MSTENQGAAVAADATPTLQPTPTAGEQQQAPAETKTDEAATSETDPAPETETPEPKKKADGGFQRRINRLTADYREAQAKAAAAEARARELEAKLTKPETSADETRAPRLEDFRSYEEYERADRQFVADKARRDTVNEFKKQEAERTAKAEQEASAKRMKEAAERFNKAADDVSEHYEDFADVMDDLWRGRIPVIRNNDAVAQYLIEESDRGPEVAYHLANNQADAERIGKLSPLAQVRELVKLEASLPKPNAPATKAPAPPKTIGGRGGSDTKDPEKMTIEELRKATGTRPKVAY